MRLFAINIIIVLLFGCESRPAWQNEGWNDSLFQPEVLNLRKATIDGFPFFRTVDLQIRNYGKPIEIIDDCTIMPIRYRKGFFSLDCWKYDTIFDLNFYKLDDTVFLGHIDFDSTGFNIKFPDFVLSSDTKFSEIKKKFPNSYSHRNIGADYLIPEGYDFIYLKDGLSTKRKKDSGIVVLRFKDNKLRLFEYRWTPEYSEEQWSEYNRYRDSINIVKKEFK